MNKTKIRLLATVFLLTVTGVAPAATIIQTESFNLTATASGGGTTVLADSNGLSASFSPFNQSLGTLLSFLIEWDLLMAAEGTTSGSGGSFTISIGGTFYVDDRSYNGGGDGGGTGSGPNTFISDSAMVMSSDNFLVTNAGVTYDPAILTAVLGMSNFDLEYRNVSDTAFTSFNDMAEITSELTGSVTLTYNYTPAIPAPASSLLLLLGLGLMGRQQRLRNR